MVFSGNDGSMPDGWYASGTPETEKSIFYVAESFVAVFSKLGFLLSVMGAVPFVFKRLYSKSDRCLV